MPNWCYNNISVVHEDSEMIKKFVKAVEEENLFDTFAPMPEELRNTTSPSPTNEELIEKYGASDWYSWALNNWGTKWDISDGNINDHSEKNAGAFFNTAWGPPLEFYDTLESLGFTVDATYTEEGMGFAGHYLTGAGDNSVSLDFDKNSAEWIAAIEDEDLRYIVQDQYDSWLEWQEEYGDDDDEETEE